MRLFLSGFGVVSFVVFILVVGRVFFLGLGGIRIGCRVVGFFCRFGFSVWFGSCSFSKLYIVCSFGDSGREDILEICRLFYCS